MERKTSLSPRQTEIMRLAADGLTDKEIAEKTGLSLGTLRSHWDRMRARMQASSRGEVIARVAEEARAELARELAILKRALDAQRILVWTATPDGTVDYANGYFSTFSGLAPEEILGEGCRRLMPPEQREESERRWQEAQGRAKGYRAHVSFRSREGELVPHLLHIAPMRDAEGKVTRWVGTAREERAEPRPEALRQAA